MALTDTAIKSFKATGKAKKVADGEGLFLFITAKGTKSWRFRFRLHGKPYELTFGIYPEISLQEARSKKLEARKLVATGKNPIEEKKEALRIATRSANNTFQSVAEEWLELKKAQWSIRHSHKVLESLKLHVFPKIGNSLIAKIDALTILDDVIRIIEKDGHTEMSHRILQRCSSILRYAVITKRIPFNPVAGLSEALKPHKAKNYPTINSRELPTFLRKLDEHKAPEIDKLAVRMLLLTFTRTGELRRSQWEHFNFQEKIWCIPKELMKMGRDHLVPLSKQAVKILLRIREISGDDKYLFPSKNLIRHPYMNENVINSLIHDLGYKEKLVGHGFRSLASTTMNELEMAPQYVIEKQLAHEERNKIKAAYNRAQYLKQRIELMQNWSDYIDNLCNNSQNHT